jgi:hypothetical protein
LLAIYEAAVAEHRTATIDANAELAAVARYLVRLAPDAKHGYAALALAGHDRARLEDELFRARRARTWRWRLRQTVRRLIARPKQRD